MSKISELIERIQVADKLAREFEARWAEKENIKPEEEVEIQLEFERINQLQKALMEDIEKVLPDKKK